MADLLLLLLLPPRPRAYLSLRSSSDEIKVERFVISAESGDAAMTRER